MARRHVVEYFLEQQALYVEMVNMLQEYSTAYEEGYLSEEQFKSVQKEINTCKDNYEFLAYIMMLLNKPNRKTKREQDFTKDLYDRLKGKSREALYDESKNALADLKAILEDADKKMREE
jgi:hypothetical protein